MSEKKIIAAQESTELLEYLLHRRTCPVKTLGDPGPGEAQIQTILRAASRVPDHGKLFPWYFMTFKGEARAQAGELLKQAWLTEEPEAAPAKLELESERFLRAPLVIGVISRIRDSKHPIWEQVLSAGAACQNLCLAANALGFGAHWLTEWYAYNETVRAGLGLDKRDHVAGFVYIGTPTEQPTDRDRPDLNEIVTDWAPDVTLNKGAEYGHPALGVPRKGFDFAGVE